MLKNPSLFSLIKKELAEYLQPFLSLEPSDIISLLEQPRQSEHGHLALPLFSLSKDKSVSPQERAKDLSEKINEKNLPILKDCQAVSAFVNFRFQEEYLKKKIEPYFAKKELAYFPDFGREHWLIDFSSPNVAKYMNIGHLRATAVGQALVNLARAFAFQVTTLNHLGDWGSQFGKLIWAYKKWGKEYDFKNEAFLSLVQLYVRFHTEAEQDENNLQEARDLFHKLEQGDLELKKIWKFFVDLSLKDYETYWKILNVRHDLTQGESFYIDFLEDLENRLKKKNLLKESEGAKVVFLEKEKVPCLIRKKDNSSTYSARDLCSLIYRFEKLKADKNIYVTGSDQNLHFRQIFQVADKINSDWQNKNLHISFGMYRFKGKGKMSSRRGQAVYLKDILDEAIQRVENIIKERNPLLPDKKLAAQQVGVGALVFYDLMHDCLKDVDFEWSKVLDFEAQSGPFVQYSLVRSRRLLSQFKKDLPPVFSKPFETSEEKQLLWRLIGFDEAVFQAFKNFKAHILARYLLALAKDFNRFYAGEKILGHEREEDLFLLVKMSYRVLSRGLEILNVPRPSAM